MCAWASREKGAQLFFGTTKVETERECRDLKRRSVCRDGGFLKAVKTMLWTVSFILGTARRQGRVPDGKHYLKMQSLSSGTERNDSHRHQNGKQGDIS